ncbi:hypothetical protein [Sphingomonas melonis]|uniref:hypothetical protein n=1 Tax=Sphingomonas melonis TaxID=152682 RepID=UPI0035C7B70E
MAPINGFYYEATGTLTYGVYGLIGGVWTFLGSQSVFTSYSGSAGGNQTMYATDVIRVSTQAQISRFRVVKMSVDDGIAGDITQVGSCTWTSQVNTGSRSATPNGEKVNATMRPVY